MKKTIILFILFILSLSVVIFLVVQEEQKKSTQTTILQNQKIQEQATSKINTEFFESKKTPTPRITLKLSPTEPPSIKISTNNALFLTISSPQNKQTIKETNILIKGKTLPRTSVMVNEFETVSDASGYFSQQINTDEGENYISIAAYSSEGEAVEKELVIIGEVSQEW